MNGSVVVRCAPWTRATDPDPCGTAGEYQIILAIEVPAPWPSDVGAISGWWHGIDPSVRALAVLPATSDRATHDRITAWRRGAGGSFVGTDYALAPGTISSQTIAAIAAGDSSPDVMAESPAPREILVCGHGQRDRCCGSLGVRLEAQLIGRLAGVRVRRCSHLGGHRFAPTAITFPDGRWWAYLDPGAVGRILDGDLGADLLARHCRGRGGLAAAAQLVERQLLAQHGSAWNEVDIATVSTAGDLDDHGATIVTMAWHGPSGRHETTARVSRGRSVPQVVCGSIGPVVKTVDVELQLDWLRTEVRAELDSTERAF